MLIPSYCSGAMVMITSLSRRVNANFECWNAWVDLADLAVMAAAGMALARLAAEVAARIAALIVVPIASAVKNMATAVSDCLSADVPAQVVAGMENIAVRHCMPLPLHCHFIGAWRGLKTKMMNPA